MAILANPARQHPAGWLSRSLAALHPEILLLGLLCLTPAAADIYSYTDSNGTVYLSNAPTNKRYQVLVAAPGEHAGNMAWVTTNKTLPGAARKIANKLKYDRMVEEVAHTYGVDSALLHAVISVESRYNPNAVSRKGASGLMQLMPGTAKRYGVVNSLDPLQNLHGGAKYLRDMLILFHSDISLAVAAYNAGETAVVRHGNHIPPFRETMDYVPKVLNFYREYRADRLRPSEAFAVNGMAHPPMPSRAAFSNPGNAKTFPPRENL